MNTSSAIKYEVAPEVWGIASAIDIYGCDPDKIRDAELIKKFVIELCDLIIRSGTGSLGYSISNRYLWVRS